MEVMDSGDGTSHNVEVLNCVFANGYEQYCRYVDYRGSNQYTENKQLISSDKPIIGVLFQ